MQYEELNQKIDEMLDENSSSVESLALRSMLEYGVFTLKERSIPNIRDGLKPVHKRFLYAMKSINLMPNTAHKKCARIVGDTIGKYHPHGDTSVYDALVGYAQPFNKNIPLVDGEGNFSSIEGDAAAAYRYTEARLSKAGALFFEDFEKDIVPLVANFDDTEIEPAYLPAPFPNLLINGAQGIAVGMTCSVPLHNPNEVIDGVRYIINQKIKNKEIDSQKILSLIPGPDFPTGGILYNLEGMPNVIENGIGKMKLRAKMEIKDLGRGKKAIVIKEIPYQVKKGPLLEKIGELVRNRNIEGVTKLRDDTNKEDISIVIELRSDVNPNLIWGTLLKETSLERTISYNCLVINEIGEVEVIGIKRALESFVAFRKEIVINKFTYIRNRAEKKLEILEGILLALVNIDEVVNIIRNASEEQDAIESLIKKIGLNVIQAKAILELKLQKLIGKEVVKVKTDITVLKEIIKNANEILSSDEKQYQNILEDLKNVKKVISRKRLTELSYKNLDLSTEDVIPEENLLITFTKKGYVKKDLASNVKDIELQEDDYIVKKIEATSHDIITFITNKGNAFNTLAYDISDFSRGKFVSGNMFDFSKDESIIELINLGKSEESSSQLILTTSAGYVKKLKVSDFISNNRRVGISISKLNEDESLFSAKILEKNQDMILISKENKIIRFNCDDVSLFGRSSRGVTGIKGTKEIVYCGVFDNSYEDDSEPMLLAFNKRVIAKPMLVSDFKVQKRAGTGVLLKVKDVSAFALMHTNDICFVDKDGSSTLDLNRVKKAAKKNVGIQCGRMQKEFSILNCPKEG